MFFSIALITWKKYHGNISVVNWHGKILWNYCWCNERFKHSSDCESIHKEIVKIADFSNISKEDLMNRVSIVQIAEQILDKRNINLDSYHFKKNASPDNNNISETPHF